jgi:uncharacterized membrane protein
MLMTVPIWDVAAALVDARLARVSFWTLALGLACAVPAALAGIWDANRVKRGTRAADALTNHILFVVAALVLFGSALELRMKTGDEPNSTLFAFVLPIAGALVLAIGGFFGAELVYSHGIGLRRSVESDEGMPSSPASSSRA